MIFSFDPEDNVTVPPPDQSPDKSANGPCAAKPGSGNSESSATNITAAVQAMDDEPTGHFFFVATLFAWSSKISWSIIAVLHWLRALSALAPTGSHCTPASCRCPGSLAWIELPPLGRFCAFRNAYKSLVHGDPKMVRAAREAVRVLLLAASIAVRPCSRRRAH